MKDEAAPSCGAMPLLPLSSVVIRDTQRVQSLAWCVTTLSSLFPTSPLSHVRSASSAALLPCRLITRTGRRPRSPDVCASAGQDDANMPMPAVPTDRSVATDDQLVSLGDPPDPLPSSASAASSSSSSPSSPSSSPSSTSASPPKPRHPQFSLLTDSVLETKWRKERHVSKVTTSTSGTSQPPPSDICVDDPALTFDGNVDDLTASDPYQAFARFTRIAAPTASLGRAGAKLPPALLQSAGLASTTPYSAAAIAHRLMRYQHSQQNLRDFVSFFQGEFDNYDQIAVERHDGRFPGEGGGHEHIHCSVQAVGEDLLFARYYFNGDPSNVFRSRLYKVAVSDSCERGLVEMRIFRFYEETERLLKANNYDLSSIHWDTDDVYDWLRGCEVFWERYQPSANGDDPGLALGIEPGTRFVGYMKGGGCEFYSREIGGCIRVMDDLLLTKEDLWVADRGFDESNEFVYGNRRGIPYKMRRVHADGSNAWTLSADAKPPDGYTP